MILSKILVRIDKFILNFSWVHFLSRSCKNLSYKILKLKILLLLAWNFLQDKNFKILKRNLVFDKLFFLERIIFQDLERISSNKNLKLKILSFLWVSFLARKNSKILRRKFILENWKDHFYEYLRRHPFKINN